jgi:succinate dehydrogenase / fumarate reductase membrane anchor subunit
MAPYVTPLKKARGLGSSKGGTEHFWLQRLTAIANIFVIAFLIYAVMNLAGAPRVAVKDFFASPLYAVLGVALALSISLHMRLGMQVIIEDYLHRDATKIVALVLNTFFSILVGVTSVLAIVKLHLG